MMFQFSRWETGVSQRGNWSFLTGKLEWQCGVLWTLLQSGWNAYLSLIHIVVGHPYVICPWMMRLVCEDFVNEFIAMKINYPASCRKFRLREPFVEEKWKRISPRSVYPLLLVAGICFQGNSFLKLIPVLFLVVFDFIFVFVKEFYLFVLTFNLHFVLQQRNVLVAMDNAFFLSDCGNLVALCIECWP